MGVPLATSQRITVSSNEAEARRVPAALNAQEKTVWVWPRFEGDKVLWKGFLDLRSQILRDLSSLAVARRKGWVGDQATSFMPAEW